MGHAYITAVAAFLPGAPVGNDEIEGRLGMVAGKPSRARGPVLRSNGIRTRHYAIDPDTGAATHTAATLAAEAIRLLPPDDARAPIDCLACATSLPDQLMPSHGSMVHGALGIGPCEVVTTSGICMSGLAALKYVMLGVKAGEFRHAVASAVERASAAMRATMFDEDRDLAPEEFEKRPSLAFEKDFLRFMLSDGAGAMRVEPRPARAGLSLRLEWIVERSYANVQPACMYAGAEKRDDGTLVGWLDTPPAEWRARSTFGVKQDARQLNEHIVEVTVVQALADVRAATGLDVSTIDCFLPHYSSGYFRDKLAAGMARAGCAIDDARWFTNLERCGNTGSASIYIMLDELLRSGRVSRGQRLLGYVPESGRFSSGWFLATAVTADDA